MSHGVAKSQTWLSDWTELNFSWILDQDKNCVNSISYFKILEEKVSISGVNFMTQVSPQSPNFPPACLLNRVCWSALPGLNHADWLICKMNPQNLRERNWSRLWKRKKVKRQYDTPLGQLANERRPFINSKSMHGPLSTHTSSFCGSDNAEKG